MLTRILPRTAGPLLIAVCSLLKADVVRVPLVTSTAPPLDPNSPIRWFTKTRIWNPGQTPAAIVITDVIGQGNPTRRNFTVPSGGVLELSAESFFEDSTPSSQRRLFATVELNSDKPIRVSTTVNVDQNNAEPCVASTGLPPFLAGGCAPIEGPILKGFREYVQPGTRVGLGWLSSPVFAYRDNLFLTNPSADSLTITARFHSFDGAAVATVVYTVPPHSLLQVTNAFGDPMLVPIDLANGQASQAAATVELSGDRPFYAFAAVVSNDVSYGSTTTSKNRFAIVEPETLP